jgi:cytidine deaminase
VAEADKYASLLEVAIRSLETSHPNQPSNLRFGAAVRTRAGQVYSASVFWSASAQLTVHAEHAALVHAAARGEREIVAVACVSTEDPRGVALCHPCGLCRQVLYESSMISGIDLDVVMGSRSGAFAVKKISELCPYPWPSPP